MTVAAIVTFRSRESSPMLDKRPERCARAGGPTDKVAGQSRATALSDLPQREQKKITDLSDGPAEDR